MSFRGGNERERGNKERGKERERKEKGERDGAIRYRQKKKRENGQIDTE